MLLAIAVVSGEIDKVSGVGPHPRYYLLGGILGRGLRTTVLLTVRTLGAGGVTAATVAGQLTTAVVSIGSGSWASTRRRSR